MTKAQLKQQVESRLQDFGLTVRQFMDEVTCIGAYMKANGKNLRHTETWSQIHGHLSWWNDEELNALSNSLLANRTLN